VSVDVERHPHLFANLYVELAQAVSTEDSEHASFGVLLVGFDNEVLRLPLVAGASGDSTLLRQCGNNSSFDFHFLLFMFSV
jgi:hypothetical protein